MNNVVLISLLYLLLRRRQRRRSINSRIRAALAYHLLQYRNRRDEEVNRNEDVDEIPAPMVIKIEDVQTDNVPPSTSTPLQSRPSSLVLESSTKRRRVEEENDQDDTSKTDVELMFLSCIKAVNHQGTEAQRNELMQKVMQLVFDFKKANAE